MNFENLSVWELVILRLLIAVAAASAGGFAAVSFKKVSHFGLCVLISFAAGALLSVALFDLFPETFELIGPFAAAVSILSGYALFWFIGRTVFHICPACAATHTEANFKAITSAMVAALAVHSFMDGLAIYSGGLIASNVGLLILVAVAYHKFPEGMALTLVARASGFSRLRAFLIAFTLEAVTTAAGCLVGFLFLVPESSRWIGYVLGHVSGGFVYLVVHALIGEAIKHHPRSTILAAVGGAVSIGLIGLWLGAF